MQRDNWKIVFKCYSGRGFVLVRICIFEGRMKCFFEIWVGSFEQIKIKKRVMFFLQIVYMIQGCFESQGVWWGWGVGRALYLRSRKLQDGKRIKVDLQLISSLQRIKLVVEGSGFDRRRKLGVYFRWEGFDMKVGFFVSDQDKSMIETLVLKVEFRVCFQV